MNQQALSSFIWSVADLLHGDYRQSEAASTEEALAQGRADVAAGRFVVESAEAHMARLEDMLATDPAGPADLA